jgi:hypothetical protein
MQRFQGDVQSGLARLEAETDLVTDLQDIVASQDHFESDVEIEDLPPLPDFTLVKPQTRTQQIIVDRTTYAGQETQLSLF